MQKSRVVFTTLALLSLLFWSRYVPAPVTDFVVDDWTSLRNALAWPSFSELLASVAREADRPGCQLAIPSTFRILGDRPAVHAGLGFAYQVATFLLLLWLAHAVSGRWRFAVLTGVFFALIPHTITSYHWAHHGAIGFVPALYLGCALSGLAYLRGRSPLFAAAAALLYGLGIATYETGLGLPLAFAAVVPAGKRRRLGALWGSLGAVLVLVLAWRFGWLGGEKEHLVNTRDYLEEGFTAGMLVLNLRETLGWWVGSHALDIVRHGLNAWSALPPWWQRGLLAGNLAIAVLAAWWMARRPAGEADAPMPRVLPFALLWTIGTQAVALISYAAAPLLFLPAMGLSLLAAWCCERCATAALRPAWAIAILAALMINQGTTVCWRDAGILNRNLYRRLQEDHAAWDLKQVLLLDTQALRQRLTPGLHTAPSPHPSVWAWYGNAALLRGFASAAMVQMINPDPPFPAVLLDVEYGVRWEGDSLIWHERFRPDRPRATPRDEVYVIGVLEAERLPTPGAAPE